MHSTLGRIIVITFFIVFSSRISNAQVLDTISKEQFKQYSYKELRGLYKDDPRATKILKRFHKNRIVAYSLYGVSAALFPLVESVGPAGLIAFAGGAYINIKNTKGKLYQQLKVYESYNSSPKQKFGSVEDTIPVQSPEKSSLVFSVSIEEFKKMSLGEIKSTYRKNDTTHLIFQLYDKTSKNVSGDVAAAVLMPVGAATIAIVFGPSLIHKDEGAAVFLVFEPLFIIGSAIAIPKAVNSVKHSSREYLFYSLQNYYQNHVLDDRTRHYVSKHIKHIKY